jgi:hypothetical protein
MLEDEGQFKNILNEISDSLELFLSIEIYKNIINIANKRSYISIIAFAIFIFKFYFNYNIKLLLRELKESFNNIYSISSLMIVKDLGIVYDSEDKLEALETIKLDEVKDICNKIKYNSSFVLVGVKDENN